VYVSCTLSTIVDIEKKMKSWKHSMEYSKTFRPARNLINKQQTLTNLTKI